MNNQSVEAQIKKYKTRRLKARLAHYSTALSIFLSLSIFANGITQNAIYSFLLFAPVLLYFVIMSSRAISKAHKIKQRLQMLEDSTYKSGLQPSFSFVNFIKQPNFAFRLSLILFFFFIFTSFARIYSDSRSKQNQLSLTYELRTY